MGNRIRWSSNPDKSTCLKIGFSRGEKKISMRIAILNPPIYVRDLRQPNWIYILPISLSAHWPNKTVVYKVGWQATWNHKYTMPCPFVCSLTHVPMLLVGQWASMTYCLFCGQWSCFQWDPRDHLLCSNNRYFYFKAFSSANIHLPECYDMLLFFGSTPAGVRVNQWRGDFLAKRRTS